MTLENVSNNRLKPQEITVVEDGDFNQQQSRQFVSNRTSSPYSATSYVGSGGTGGGGPSWHGKCPHCYQEYANISSLKYHVRLVHSEANNTICCYLCPQNFSSKLIMREHLFTCHNVKYQWILLNHCTDDFPHFLHKNECNNKSVRKHYFSYLWYET